jgi:hypothetical protein
MHKLFGVRPEMDFGDLENIEITPENGLLYLKEALKSIQSKDIECMSVQEIESALKNGLIQTLDLAIQNDQATRYTILQIRLLKAGLDALNK